MFENADGFFGNALSFPWVLKDNFCFEARKSPTFCCV